METLESIKVQSYRNIELIVADDGSEDDTRIKAGRWLEANNTAFSSTTLVRAARNGGIPANCNNGLASSKGVYIKFIAADDVLLADCIEADLRLLGDAAMLCTAMLFKRGDEIIPPPNDKAIASFFSLPDKKLMRRYVRRPIFLNTPSFFFHRDVLESVGGFDERIRLLEDQPIVCKLLAGGHKIQYAGCPTVVYRLGPASVTGKRSPAFLDSQFLCYTYYIRPALKWTNLIDLLVIIESSIYFLLERKHLTASRLYILFMRSRPSRFFLEGDFLHRAFKRLFYAGGQGG